MIKNVMLYLVLALVIVGGIPLISAMPAGPTTEISIASSSRYPTWGSKTLPAEAGNVTEFNTNTSTITRTWQGYFGNITGIIVLGDSNNNTMYDWQVASPRGEIYAVSAATVPSWFQVRCANQTELQAEDARIGVNESVDEDAVNETFVIGGSDEAVTNYGGAIVHPLFYVANVTITANSCPVAAMYNSSRKPSEFFKEVILSDGATVPIIYTGIIAHTLNPFQESDGFDARTHDFEMLVGENGHGTDTSTVLYYFYLELG